MHLKVLGPDVLWNFHCGWVVGRQHISVVENQQASARPWQCHCVNTALLQKLSSAERTAVLSNLAEARQPFALAWHARSMVAIKQVFAMGLLISMSLVARCVVPVSPSFVALVLDPMLVVGHHGLAGHVTFCQSQSLLKWESGARWGTASRGEKGYGTHVVSFD
jgi:hypothetical protein